MVEGTAQRLDEQVAAVIDKAMHDSWANAPMHGTTNWFGPASLREYLVAAVSELVRGQADALQAAERANEGFAKVVAQLQSERDEARSALQAATDERDAYKFDYDELNAIYVELRKRLEAKIQAVEALLPKARVIYDHNDMEIEYVETRDLAAALGVGVPTEEAADDSLVSGICRCTDDVDGYCCDACCEVGPVTSVDPPKETHR